MSFQNPQRGVAITHGGSAGHSVTASRGADKGDRLEAGTQHSALLSPSASAGTEHCLPSLGGGHMRGGAQMCRAVQKQPCASQKNRSFL